MSTDHRPETTMRPSLLLWLSLLSAATGLHAQTPTVAVGNEFQVNTYTTNYQEEPAVAMDAEGNFVVVWRSDGSSGNDTSGRSVQGQRYASGGNPLGANFQVNSYTTGGQTLPSIAMGADGTFVVVWASYGSSGGDTLGYSVQGQRYASGGDLLGAQFQINSYTTNSQATPSVSMGPDGAFVVVWDSSGSSGGDTSFGSVQGQRFASDGDPLGAQFQINSYTTNSQGDPSVSVGPDGAFVVVWLSDGSDDGDTSLQSVQGQRFASNGDPLAAQFQVNSYTTEGQFSASVVVNPDSEFLVVWASEGSSGGDPSGRSVQGQRYASNGDPQGAQFLVNSYTTDDQGGPALATDSDGDWVVVWYSYGSYSVSSSGFSVQAQRFASGGDPVASQFQVNSYTTGYQGAPAAAVGPNGDFVVVWQGDGSDLGDTSDYSIHGQRFRATADVGDRVFEDADFDGRQDASEAGVAGVTVHLRTDLGDLVDSTTTNVDGGFLFQPKIALDGMSDSFYVQFEAPAATAFTAPDVGSDDTIDSDADPVSGETATFEVASAGEEHTDLDAGLIDDAAVIGDRIWYDADRDGLQQVDEAGVASVTVRLLDAADQVVAGTMTDADGIFAFADPGTGTYSIAIVVPAGLELTELDVGVDDEIDSDVDPLTARSASFAYTSGTISREHDAGLRAPAEIFADGFESGDTAAWSTTVN